MRIFSKPYFILSAVFILTLSIRGISVSQFGWEQSQIGRQFMYCTDIVDSQVAFAAGSNGIVVYTTNRGVHWRTSFTGYAINLLGISFSDRYTGTVVSGNYILRTIDGGLTWFRQSNGLVSTNNYNFYDVSFLDGLNGVAVGYRSIFQTTNGGEVWRSARTTAYQLKSVALKGNIGFAAGDLGAIYRTTNGGSSWTTQSSGTINDLSDIWIVDSLNAFVCGGGGTLLRTTNAGMVWTAIPAGTAEPLKTVWFSDSLHGIIGGSNGSIFRTTNAGLNWLQYSVTNVPDISYYAFNDPEFGVAVSPTSPAIYRTFDQGFSWHPVSYSFSGNYYDAAVTSEQMIYIVGDGGIITRSSDAGVNWNIQHGGVITNLYGIDCVNNNECSIVGDSGVILETQTGGTPWVRKQSGTSATLRDVSFSDQDHGTAVGDNNTVLRTTDGGNVWVHQNSGINDNWQGVSFRDVNNGIVVGENGSIITTSNGGETWNLNYSYGQLNSVQYVDDNTLIAVGKHFPSQNPNDLILRSINGGSEWHTPVVSFSSAGESSGLLNVTFLTDELGFASRSNGDLLMTFDAGETWHVEYTGFRPLNAVSAFNPRTVIGVSNEGSVYKLIANAQISGKVYNDRNANGVQDVSEENVGGAAVELQGRIDENVVTDINGNYFFTNLPFGDYRIESGHNMYWEQTQPSSFGASLFGGYPVKLFSSGQHVSGKDIGIHGPVVKVKIPISACDDTSEIFGSTYGNRNIYWGVRPGATFGIKGASPLASEIDSMEYEAEIPPRDFAELIGLFDVRLQDPRYTVRDVTYDFGMGTWTDMRDFISTEQVDTYLISLLAGYIYGGKYPITLRWSNERVMQSFNGPVTLRDPHGGVVDMKKKKRMVITDSTIHSLILTAHYPNIPKGYGLAWHLISVPYSAADPRTETLFPSASTVAFSFNHVTGYNPQDTLIPGSGYWLTYRSAIDTLSFDHNERLRDTLTLSKGWNVVGTLSSPIATTSVEIDPPGVAIGSFFSYDDRYILTDSLIPRKAYWVKSDNECNLILDVSATNKRESNLAVDIIGSLQQSNNLTFRDAVGKVGTVYFSSNKSIVNSVFELPPLPPKGAFDVRFVSNRMLEILNHDQSQEFPILVQSPVYPLTVQWEVSSADGNVALNIAGREIPLTSKGETEITSSDMPSHSLNGASPQISLVTYAGSSLPKEYALRQNYPNPFNPSTIIKYSLPQDGSVKLSIYNTLGQEVRTIVDEYQQAGYKSVRFDAHGLPSGVYFYRLTAGSFTDTRKLLLIK